MSERERPILIVRRADGRECGVRQWSNKDEVTMFPSCGRDDGEDTYYSATQRVPKGPHGES
jgi:hypothetical protein